MTGPTHLERGTVCHSIPDIGLASALDLYAGSTRISLGLHESFDYSDDEDLYEGTFKLYLFHLPPSRCQLQRRINEIGHRAKHDFTPRSVRCTIGAQTTCGSEEHGILAELPSVASSIQEEVRTKALP
jgi:hypothetical protein